MAHSRVYTATQSARFGDRSLKTVRAGPAAGPDAREMRCAYCFLDTEMFVMSKMPYSKSSALSVTPWTYGFRRYFVAEE